MAIAVFVVLGGLVVGVTFELLWSKRRQASERDMIGGDEETLKPSQPRFPEPRFIDDGEGFRIIGPVEYEDPGAAPWESDDDSRPDSGS